MEGFTADKINDYAGGGSLNENIDTAGGEGTGEFARQAIEIYCK